MSANKRSITIRGHRTSVSVEPEFWDALRSLAREDGCAPSELITAIDTHRGNTALSSAIRLYVLRRLRDRAGRRIG